MKYRTAQNALFVILFLICAFVSSFAETLATWVLGE